MTKEALAHKIEMLESQLATALPRVPPEPHKDRGASPGPQNPDQVAVLSLLSLGRDHNDRPAYLGPSSGRTIAKSLGRMAQDTVWTESIPINAGPQQNETTPSSPSATRNISLPGHDVGARLIEAYFRDMHNRLPFLDRSEIYELHETMHQNNAYDIRKFGTFKIFMIYAIGASILQMTDVYEATPPRDFWATATGAQSALKSSSPYARIEAIMLLILYDLRTSSRSSVWYTIGLAMRICVDLGLHRETQYRAMRPHDAQLRRRLFWSVYLVERYVSWSLGRPFSVAEKDIDANIPAEMDDTTNNGSQVDQVLQTPSDPATPASGPNLHRFIATIRLQRILSRIHAEIYRVDRNVSALVTEVPPLMACLEDFERSQPVMALDDSTFVRMHWYNCIRMLLQRFLSTLPSEDPLIQKCLFASGQMCQCFKTLRQRDSAGYSFLLVNSLFMAGLTMWYVSSRALKSMADSNSLCLFRAPQLWSVAVSDDLRACSYSMFMMAERNTTLRRYRHGLETVMARAVKFVHATKAPSDDVEGPTPGDPHTQWPRTDGTSYQSIQMMGSSHGFAQWLNLPTPPLAAESLHADATSLRCHGLQEMLDSLQSKGDMMTDDFWADIPWASLAE